MLVKIGTVYVDPSEVSDINVGDSCVWLNRRHGLRGLRIQCAPHDEYSLLDFAAAQVNAALAGEAVDQ